MTRTKSHPRAIALSAGLLLALAACDSSTILAALSGINSLGQGFVSAFNADPNSEPVDPDTVTLVITPTREPFNP